MVNKQFILSKYLSDMPLIPYNVFARKIVIALSDGHGADTTGKRTPTFPEGGIMKENEFNSRVVTILKEELERCGFGVLLVAPTDYDTPLIQRTNLANAKKVDLYLSVHANAFNGRWGNAAGIETFTSGKGEGLRIGKILQAELLKGTKMPDRGMKDGNHLHEIRATNMPAVLVECGFMDNLKEARELRKESYRQETAIELARGLCIAYKVNYVPKGNAKPATSTPSDSNPWSKGYLIYGDRGHDVQMMQKYLTQVGFPAPESGYFNAETKRALMDFQKARGLEDDGVYGAGSKAEMNVALKEPKKSVPKPNDSKTLYRVQVGAFGVRANADGLAKELKGKGYETSIVTVGNLFKVQTGAFGVRANAEALATKLEKAGYKPFIVS